jgi:hypothetical protein
LIGFGPNQGVERTGKFLSIHALPVLSKNLLFFDLGILWVWKARTVENKSS